MNIFTHILAFVLIKKTHYCEDKLIKNIYAYKTAIVKIIIIIKILLGIGIDNEVSPVMVIVVEIIFFVTSSTIKSISKVGFVLLLYFEKGRTP